MPYLGFPISWKNILFTLTGLGLIYFSYLLYKESKASETEKETFDNFRENGNFIKTENKETDPIGKI